MTTVTLATDFNPESITFGKEKINKKGGRNIPILDNGSEFMLQTPVRMRIPFDVQVDELDNGMKKYSINIALGGSPEAELFRDKLDIMDTIVRTKVSEISQNLWGSHKSVEVCEELVKPMVRIPKNEMYDPLLKLKMPIYSNGPTFEVYSSEKDSEGNPIEIQFYQDGIPDFGFLPKNSKITALIVCEGLWVIQKNVYCTWKIAQLKVYKQAARVSGYHINDNGADDEDDESYPGEEE